MYVYARTHALQPVHPFNFVFVRLYFSIPVPGSPADILLYTVSAPSRPIGPIAPSELGYSVCAGQFQYVTSMSAHTQCTGWKHIGRQHPDNPIISTSIYPPRSLLPA